MYQGFQATLQDRTCYMVKVPVFWRYEEFEISFTEFLICLQFFGMVLAIHPFGWVLLASQSCVFFFGVFVSRLAVILSYHFMICVIWLLESSQTYGYFQKWWYPTTMGFPTKNDHFGVFWGYHHFRKPPFLWIYKWPWIFRLSQVTT